MSQNSEESKTCGYRKNSTTSHLSILGGYFGSLDCLVD